MLNSKIKGVILDLDNTLYGYDLCHDYALSQVLLLIENELGIKYDIVIKLYENVKHKLKIQLNHTAASHHRLLYFQYLCEELTVPPFEYAYNFYQYYWSKFLEVMRLNDGVLTFLEFCKKNNILVCILTDLTADIQYRKIDRLGIGKYLNYLVTSEEVLFDKPHPIMFYTAITKMQLNQDEVIMIGDSWNKDIVGAENIGIKSIHFTLETTGEIINKNILSINSFVGLEQKI